MLPSASGTFTFLVIPDTQNLSRHHPDVFASMTRWIARHAEDLSIQLVAHLGDVVDGGARKVEQYLAASAAVETMYEAGIPLLIAPGNHDYDLPIVSSSKWDADSDPRALSMFNHYFGLHRVQHQSWFGGEFEQGQAENMYARFAVQDAKLLFLVLEFGPRDEVLTWANTVISDHADHQVFIITHCYMYMNGERTKPGDDANPKKYVATANGNDGEDIWHKVLRHHPNVIAVFSGHHIPVHVSHRIDEGVHGNRVVQLFQNWQSEELGGSGRFRIVAYDTVSRVLNMRVFNPHTEEFETDRGYELNEPL